MTYRPYDWSPLAGSDPVPGDPDEVERLANEYRDTALEIEQQSRVLRRLSTAGGWDSEAGEVFAAEAKELAGKLGKAHGRYAAVSMQLRRWAPALREAQREADRALADAKDAEARQRANSRSLLEGVDEPSPELEAAERRRRSAADDAADAIAAARRRLDHAVDSLDRTARSVANAIEEASDDDVKDGFWDKVKGFIKDHAKVIHAIAEVLSKIGTVLALVAIVFGGPLVWIALGLSALAFAGKLALAMAGEGSWLDAALEGAGLLLFGYGQVLARSANAARVAARQAASQVAGQRAAAQVVSKHRVSLGIATRVARSRFPLGPLRNVATGHVARIGARADDAYRGAARAVLDAPLRPAPILRRITHLDARMASYSDDVAGIVRQYRTRAVAVHAAEVRSAALRFRLATGTDTAIDVAGLSGQIPGTQPHFSQAVGRCTSD